MMFKKKRLKNFRQISIFLLGATTTTTLVLAAPPVVGHLFKAKDKMAQVALAQVTASQNIATVTDTGAADRVVNWDAAEVARRYLPVNGNNNGAYVANGLLDPAGQTYVHLVNAQNPQVGLGLLRNDAGNSQVFDNKEHLVITGYFKNTTMASGNNSKGDFLGIALFSDAVNLAGTDTNAQGMGIQGTKYTRALGIDYAINTDKNDPTDAGNPFGALRGTDSAGAMYKPDKDAYQGMGSWGTTVQYQLEYIYDKPSGMVYLQGFLMDPNHPEWKFSFSKYSNAGGNYALTPSGYLMPSLLATNGSGANQEQWGSIDSIQGTKLAKPVQVFYREQANQNTDVAPSTTFTASVGDKIGITGFSAGAIAGTDQYTYDGSVPATAAAKYKQGWHISQATSWNDSNAQDITVKVDATQNTYTLFYSPDVQQARVLTDSTDPKGAQTVETLNGTTAGAISGWTKTDNDLARPGYSYTVTGPDGVKYNTLAAAQAATANKTYDSTSNGAATTDSAPQDFKVTYSRGFQQAIVKTVQNGSTTTLATYDTTTTPNRPLENGTSGQLMGKVSDASLAKQGYSYTVTGPDGKSYPTMQEAWQAAANNQWDSTNNPAGGTTDSSPQTWTVNYVGQQQTATIDKSSSDGQGPSGNQETKSGSSDSNIGFTTTDDQLKTSGYSYTVSVYDGDTLLGNYNNLADAIAANPRFDNTANDGTSDKASQKFSVLYTPLDESYTSNYVDDKGNVIKAPTSARGKTNSDIDTSKPPTIDGYVFKEVQASSDKKVKSDGTAQVTYVYQIDPVIIKAANDADTSAKSSNVKNEAAVTDAEKKLADTLADPKATPTQIQDATKGLNDAVTQAQADRQKAIDDANAVDKAVKESSVANEPGVQNAEKNLQDTLNNPASTTEQIKDATHALNDAAVNSTADRKTAETNAETAIKNADNSTVAKDPSVVKAEDALKAVLADPNSTSKQIDDATKVLNDAVTNANSDKSTATNNATNALNNTSPVSNEPGVVTAEKNLRDTMAKPDATAKEIQDATDALNKAVSDAKTARDTANTNAETAKSNATASSTQNDPAVKDAQQKLQQIQDSAAKDSASDLTQNITDATKALNDAVTAAAAGQSEARGDAATAMANTSPYSNEAIVKAAKDALAAKLADPAATEADIKSATNALNSALASAKTDRDAAKAAAANEIKHVDGNVNDQQNQTVQDLKRVLQDTISRADADSANDLTQQIIDATKALDDAADAVDAAHAAAMENATKAVQSSAPVSNEAAVKTAMDNLKNVMSADTGNSSTQEITNATNALNDAIATAKTDRTAADSAASQAITAANDSPHQNDRAVQDAITALQNAQKEAAADSPTVLTKNIQDLTSALNDAVAKAETDRAASDAAAGQAITNASPVSNEPNVKSIIDQLNTAMADPKTPASTIDALTKSLNDTAAAEKATRDQTITDSTNAMTTADNSPVGNEQSVKDAEKTLQDLIDKSKTDDPSALTNDIQKAEDALKKAQSDAQALRDIANDDAAKAITNAESSGGVDQPNVSNETAVKNADDALKAVLADKNSTTQQIADATKALDDAVAKARDDRNTAYNDALKAKDDADKTTVANEPSVKQAEDALQAILDNPNSTTQQIQDATQAVKDAVTQEQAKDTTAKEDAQKAIDAADASNVAKDPSVVAAEDNLKKVLDDPNSTTEQITDATKNLNDAVKQAQDDRQAAIDKGNQAIKDADASPAANNPQVVNDKQALQDLINDPNSTPQQITDATNNLNNSVADAGKSRDDAIADANRALDPANTSPVSNETAVAQAIQDLQTIKNDPTSTSSQIENSVRALDQAVADAKTARNAADTNAASALDSAKASPSAQEPGVAAAAEKLEDLVAKAKTDDATALTKDIAAATQELKDAQTTAEAARNTAKQSIATADGSKVVSEPSVVDAKNKLNELLNDPASTNQQIIDATKTLDEATAQALADIQAAEDGAQTAIKNADASNVAKEPAVVQAEQELKDKVANPNTTIQEIRDATKTLNDTVAAAQADRETALENANNALSDAGHTNVANEPAVKAAEDVLKAIVADPDSSTQQLIDGTKALDDAVKQAGDARNNAVDAGNKAIADADASKVSTDPTVKADRDKLQDLLSNPNSTIDDITKATDELNNAVKAGEDRAEAVDQAEQAIKDANNSPAANDPAVVRAKDDLQAILDNPNSTP
ncbi:MAG: MucBP domain-containing protein, partial [Streptococcaceae bacterium]|nr:MucBP domain-containing protein [Streptococcaceae bacterium]